MNKNGYIYPTIELNSDGSELFHNGYKKMGFGRTNDLVRRFKEHASRGSKATVGVNFLDPIDCDEVAIPDTELEYQLHRILKNIGYINIERTSIFEKENENVVSSTEVFSGVSKKNINGVVSVGEELSVDLLKRIVSNLSNVDLFKEDLILLPHQEKTWMFIKEKFTAGVKEILLNHKPRSGKSFICYYYLINEKPQNVLLLTQYPILNGQWKAEFENLRGHNYNIIISRDVDKIVLSKTQPNFVMISLQDAKGEDVDKISDNELVEGLKKQKFSELKRLVKKWDLIIFDEVHKGKETFKTDKLLAGLKYDRLIGLTATATKNLLRGSFLIENIDRYTLVEENEYKIKYPTLYKNPKINHLHFNVDENLKKELEFFKKEEGFTFNKFLEVNNEELVYKNDLIKFFNWFFCKGRYNRKTNATFEVINKCQSILLFVDNNECQSKLKELLDESVGDIYDIYFTNSDVNSSAKLLDKIKGSKRKSAEYDPKNGKKVIIIANRQLTTGVTLKYCDMVVFMNDWKSIDEYIQASYRCQSPNDKKEVCYVVDLNPGRAYTILHSYIESNSTYKKDDINNI
jgi:superfamily II DNA or RNA helicase